MRAWVRACVRACLCACVRSFVRTYERACVRVCVCVCVRAFTCAFMDEWGVRFSGSVRLCVMCVGVTVTSINFTTSYPVNRCNAKHAKMSA